MRKVIITTAMLLAGTAIAMAQGTNSPGPDTQDQNSNGAQNGRMLNGDNPGNARAQGQMPQGQSAIGGGRAKPADAANQQTEKNNEEIGLPPK